MAATRLAHAPRPRDPRAGDGLPFTMTPEPMWEDERLSDGAVRLLGWLTAWLRNHPGRFPTLRETASRLRWSVSKVTRGFRQLEAAGYVVRRPAVAGRRESTMAFSLRSGGARLAPPPPPEESQLPLFPEASETSVHWSPMTNIVVTDDQHDGHQRPTCWSPMTIPPDPPIEGNRLETADGRRPPPSSLLPIDEDRARALGERLAKLCTVRDPAWCEAKVREWVGEFSGGLDWVERAVENAEDEPDAERKKPGWFAFHFRRWQANPALVFPPRPEPVEAPPVAVRVVQAEPEPEADPTPTADEIPGLVEQARNRGLPDYMRRAAKDAIEKAVEAGVVGGEVLSGIEERDGPGPEEKPAAGPATKHSPRPANPVDSPRDSSLNSRSDQVSLESSPLRSALSGRDLTPCSPIRASPL